MHLSESEICCSFEKMLLQFYKKDLEQFLPPIVASQSLRRDAEDSQQIIAFSPNNQHHTKQFIDIVLTIVKSIVSKYLSSFS